MTTDARHSKQTLSNGGIHSMIAYEYADETARLAATGFDSFDLYKVALQLDTGVLYLLADISPITWVDFGNAGITTKLNKVRIECRKASAGTLAVGTVVYATSWNCVGDYAEVEAARADSPTTLPAAGVIDVEATDSSTGSLLVVGVLCGLNTSSFSAQSPLYLSHTAAGEFTDTPPPGPYVSQVVGVVLNSDVSAGHIGVNIQDFRAIEYTATPEDLGVAASAGTANTASASDHVHKTPDIDDLGTGTLAELNSKITDATLDDSSSARTPTAHQATHNSGGSDALKLDDLAAPDDNTDLDSTTSQHGLLPKLGGGTTNFLRADGTWAAPPASDFGSDFSQGSSDGESTTTSGTYQQKLRLTTGALASGGIYRIGYSYEWRLSNLSNPFGGRAQIDDTTTIHEQSAEPKDVNSWYEAGGFYYFTGTGAAIDVDLDYRAGGGTAYIRRARLEVWRVS